VNRSTKVSPAVRRAVERAVKELGYTPNRAARSLVTRRSDSIGLVVTESEERIFGEPFFASLIRGVSDALAETDIQLVLLLSRSDGERSRIERFLSTHLDGVLLVSAHAEEPLLEPLVAGQVPAVLAGRPLRPTSLPYVDVDNLGGASLAVTHLLERGRRRIATIAGPQDMAAGIDRLTGYRETLAAVGTDDFSRAGTDDVSRAGTDDVSRAGTDDVSRVGTDDVSRVGTDDLVAVGDFSAASGERAAQQLLERRPDLDAIFAASDLMAVGALQALQRAGRRVPDDVAVVGFDDSVVATTTLPQLTSVHQPTGDLGRQMILRLRDALDGPSLVPSATVLPTHLVVRDSS
jgi:DNA-binding LacI/PurR family transcriptional regulator